MPALAESTLRGYILEEVLARLVKNAGYRLLVDASQDLDELDSRANGLVVRGRGGVHQVDVLGELAWIPAFTFPIRLIVEAKARGHKSGIDDVRNAVGVVTDVNQNFYRGPGSKRPLTRRYAYRYALFSTSGFSRPAADYAIAHEISLIDLSASSFEDIVQVAAAAASALSASAAPTRSEGFIGRLRTSLRHQLGTWPEDVWTDEADPEIESLLTEASLRQRVERVGELFLGMANGPSLLVLRADDPSALIEFLDRNPVQDVVIHWSRRTGGQTDWTISVAPGAENLGLHFALPESVATWIFAEGGNARRRALQFKQDFLSSITIYRYVNGRDHLYRLRFAQDQLPQEWRIDHPEPMWPAE